MSHLSEQLAFPGFDRPPTDRLFFAILPDARATARAAAIVHRLSDEFGLLGWPLAPQRLHVSLHFLGDFDGLPGDLVGRAREAAAAARSASFDIAFDRVGSFGKSRRRPLVMQAGNAIAPLFAFHRMLGAAMARQGLGRYASTRFTPHMTLLYEPRMVTARFVEPVAWKAREFVLVHSLLGRTKHIILGRWPLPAM